MSRSRVVWAIVAVSVIVTSVSSVLYSDTSQEALTETIGIMLFGVVGAVVLARHPRHGLGRTFVAIAAVYAAFAPLGAYVGVSLDREVPLPATDWVALPFNAAWGFFATMLIVHSLLLFPDGRPAGRFWHGLYRFSWLNAAVATVSSALWPGLLRDQDIPFDNPLGVPALSGVAEIVALTAYGLMLVMMLLAASSLVIRYRGSDQQVRQQLKLLTYAGALLVAVAIPYFGGLLGELSEIVWGVAISLLPLSIGAAILRYRLYDIDILIKKTLVYGALTVTLGAGYFGIVVLLQQLMRPFTQGSDLAIAGSTLAVAAAFRPARRAIQTFVDRRFYRQRYDATRTLEAFSARLRQEVDIDSLAGELTSVVGETVQPAHVSMWVRSAGGHS